MNCDLSKGDDISLVIFGCMPGIPTVGLKGDFKQQAFGKWLCIHLSTSSKAINF
jgi:hypothetical protein